MRLMVLIPKWHPSKNSWKIEVVWKSCYIIFISSYFVFCNILFMLCFQIFWFRMGTLYVCVTHQGESGSNVYWGKCCHPMKWENTLKFLPRFSKMFKISEIKWIVKMEQKLYLCFLFLKMLWLEQCQCSQKCSTWMLLAVPIHRINLYSWWLWTCKWTNA